MHAHPSRRYGSKVYTAALSGYSASSTIEVTCAITIVLEGRSDEELPERPLAAVEFSRIQPGTAQPPGPAWPSDADDVPGTTHRISWRDVQAAVKAVR